jgi:hypothetical protein
MMSLQQSLLDTDILSSIMRDHPLAITQVTLQYLYIIGFEILPLV